jgi:hypothetical protein
MTWHSDSGGGGGGGGGNGWGGAFGAAAPSAAESEDDYARRLWEEMERRRSAAPAASAAARAAWAPADKAAARRQARARLIRLCLDAPHPRLLVSASCCAAVAILYIHTNLLNQGSLQGLTLLMGSIKQRVENVAAAGECARGGGALQGHPGGGAREGGRLARRAAEGAEMSIQEQPQPLLPACMPLRALLLTIDASCVV